MSYAEKIQRSSAGCCQISLGGVLAIVFIILKLTHVVSWSWLWVLSPLWLPTTCILVFFLCMFVAAALMDLFKKS